MPAAESQALLLEYSFQYSNQQAGTGINRGALNPRPCSQAKIELIPTLLIGEDLPDPRGFWGYPWRVRSRAIRAVGRVWRSQLRLNQPFRKDPRRD